MVDINTLKFPVYDDVAIDGQWFSSFGVYVAGTEGIELSLLPAKNVIQADVMGMHGGSFSHGKLEAREMLLPIYIKDVTNIDSFKNLIMFTEPKWISFKNTGTKIKGVFTNSVIAKSNGREATFSLTLTAPDPFFYEETPRVLTYTSFAQPIIFQNTGNSYSFPTFEITGKGNVVLGVNGQTLTIAFSPTSYETLVINTRTCEVKKGTANRLYSLIEMDFPTLTSGQSTIAVTGDCTNLKITPNSRWI